MSSQLHCQESQHEEHTDQLVEFLIERNNTEGLFTLMVKHAKQTCRSDFPPLFKLLNLDEISIGFLAEVVLKEPLVLENVECLNLVTKKLLQIIKDKSSIVSLGGIYRKGEVKEVYNLSDEPLKKFSDLQVEVINSCSLKMDESIVCVGGEKRVKKVVYTASNQVCQMNLMNDDLEWKKIPSMNEKRYSFGAAVFQDSIVVAGGYDGKNYLDSAEIFKQTNRWKLIASLNQARRNHAVVESVGCLFVMGGWNGTKALSSVERLSGLNKKWKYILEPMKYPRQLFAAVTCQNKIFAIGGLSKKTRQSAMKSVEMFDHSKQKWSEVKSMNIERWGHSACVLQNKIFVVGGKNKKKKFVNEIECYDVYTKQWSILSQETNNFMLHSVVALIKP